MEALVYTFLLIGTLMILFFAVFFYRDTTCFKEIKK